MQLRLLKAATGLALLSILATGPAMAAPSHGDKSFLSDAAEGNMAEVALGKLASQKGSNSSVKLMGKHMIQDHTKMMDDVRNRARQENVTIPETLSNAQQSTMDKLSKLSGADFDKAYTKEMVSDHKSDLAAFQKEQKDTKDQGIKTLLSKAIPIIQSHLSMFNTLQARLSGHGSAAMTSPKVN